MLIPESLLQKEKDHVEGFAPECAWVTYGGTDKLEERYCIRPFRRNPWSTILSTRTGKVKGNADRVRPAAWVTYGGTDKLEERYCIRPTSETLFCEHYANIIHGWTHPRRSGTGGEAGCPCR